MPIKTSFSILLPVVLLMLLAASLFVDSRNDGTTPEQDIASSGAVFDRLSGNIDGASGSAEFAAIAHKIIEETPEGPARLRLIELLLDRWFEKDLPAALNFVSNIEQADTRKALLQYALVEGAYLDFRGVMAWINRQPESSRQDLAGMLYEGVGKENPGYALEFIDLLNEGEFKEHVMRVLLEHWGQWDTAAALSWMNAQVLPQSLGDVKASLLSRLMAQDPHEAGGMIRNMQPSHQKNTLARKYADMMAMQDVQAAAGWARSLDDPNSYGIALTAVYEAWFRQEPDKRLIMEQVMAESDSDLRDRLINEIALDIANSNPAELAAMVDRLPETSQPDVAEKTVRFWKDRDPGQTLNWIDTLAPGPVRDRAVKIMVEDFLLRGDKEEALSLAATIEDRGLRYKAVRSAAEHWYQADPEEARRILNDISFLSESEKEAIDMHIQQIDR